MMQNTQAEQLAVQAAIAEAPATITALSAMAREQRRTDGRENNVVTLREWLPDARTFCYHTHIAITGQHQDRLEWLAGIFFHSDRFESQPWYPEFLGSQTCDIEALPASDVSKHHLAWGRFDLGLGQPRYYRQLVSLAALSESEIILAARSVIDGPLLPDRAKLAFTLHPNGEVFYFEGGVLHWHHICCTPGAGLLPQPLDRWFINFLRRTGMDGAERGTYRAEAEQLRDWLQSPSPEQALKPA